MWCTERSKGNRISHRHSSHSSEDIRLPWLTTTANKVRTAQLRTSDRLSVLLIPCRHPILVNNLEHMSDCNDAGTSQMPCTAEYSSNRGSIAVTICGELREGGRKG